MYSLALLASFGKLKNKKAGDFCPEILSNIDIGSIDLYVKVFFFYEIQEHETVLQGYVMSPEVQYDGNFFFKH